MKTKHIVIATAAAVALWLVLRRGSEPVSGDKLPPRTSDRTLADSSSSAQPRGFEIDFGLKF